LEGDGPHGERTWRHFFVARYGSITSQTLTLSDKALNTSETLEELRGIVHSHQNNTLTLFRSALLQHKVGISRKGWVAKTTADPRVMESRNTNKEGLE